MIRKINVESMPNFLQPDYIYNQFHYSKYGYLNFKIKKNLNSLFNYNKNIKKCEFKKEINKIFNIIDKRKSENITINNKLININSKTQDKIKSEYNIFLDKNDFVEVQCFSFDNEIFINYFKTENIKKLFSYNYEKILKTIIFDKINFINEIKLFDKYNEYQNSILNLMFDFNEMNYLKTSLNYNDILKILKEDYLKNSNSCKNDFWGKKISIYDYKLNLFKTLNSNLFNKNLTCHSLLKYYFSNKKYKNYSLEFSQKQIKSLFLIYGFLFDKVKEFETYCMENLR